jgi:tetratricopeptide (TPR) repeat protein
MRDAAHRQLNFACALALCVAMAQTAAAGSGWQDELRAARLVENAVLTRLKSDGSSREGDLSKLDAMYRQLVEKHPENAEMRDAYGEFLWSIERRPDAMDQWETAEKFDPKNADVAYHLGGCHLALGNARRATDYFSRASSLDPKDALYHYSLGTALYLFRHEVNAGDPASVIQQSLDQYRIAAELEPFNSEYLRAYAEAFYGLTVPDWKEALNAWGRYLELTQARDYTYSHLARVNLKMGRKSEARELLSKIESNDFARVKSSLLKQAAGE